MLTLLQDKMDTPLGPLWVLCDEQFNLRAVEWDEHRDRMETLLDVHYRREGYQRVDCRNPGGLSSKLSDYFAGDLAIIETLPTATAGTPFQRQVWQALRDIPCGQVMHYGQLAEALGRPGAARAVGAANGANPVSIVVPCHRVIGPNGMTAALTSMLCMGAPLSSTQVAGIASLRLQKTAAAAGAVVPGWAAIEELGGVDTVQVDADELFTADSVNLEDIRIFKGGRIDRAILYAASILNHSCETLRGLFRQIIEDRTEILYPVKDLEVHHGLGFAAWCDNNRVLIGNRLYMEREGVPLPEQEYEDEHSQNGALQILYLAVSGSLHAMFVLHYVGGRNAARGLEVLQRENIRLLVTCEDPSLTAHHITEAYHLPEGMITLLDQEQCSALTPAQPDETARCCMLHDKGFASLIGGLRAAEKAQNAETSATTVQMVSVWFSVVIGALLTYAGRIGTLSVAAVLMYQAAWSALSIAVCALKQHN